MDTKTDTPAAGVLASEWRRARLQRMIAEETDPRRRGSLDGSLHLLEVADRAVQTGEWPGYDVICFADDVDVILEIVPHQKNRGWVL